MSLCIIKLFIHNCKLDYILLLLLEKCSLLFLKNTLKNDFIINGWDMQLNIHIYNFYIYI